MPLHLIDFFVVKLKGTDGSDFTPPVCGNHFIELGEQCDDGNTLDGDCCSSLCQFEQDGSACSEGNACTQTDTYQGGVCTGTNPVFCVL
jgi:cysteine-rich repeat protein